MTYERLEGLVELVRLNPVTFRSGTRDTQQLNPINRVTSYLILEILKSRIEGFDFKDGFTFVYITNVGYGYYRFPTNKNYSLSVNWFGRNKPSDELEPQFVGILCKGVIYM